MKKDIAYENSLLKLRFTGDCLKQRSIPIYELGVSLISIQRMIHKSYLTESNQQATRPYLSNKERASLALQLAGRKKASDGYGLITVLNSPFFVNTISNCIGGIMAALAIYGGKTLLKRDPKTDEKTHTLAVFIFNQVSDISSRINSVGNIETIEIAGHSSLKLPPVIINAETKKYVSILRDEMVFGLIQEIQGKLVELIPSEDAVKIFTTDNRLIKVQLSNSDFELVRYSEHKNPVLKLIGEPIYRLGVETYHYEAFSAHSMELIP